MLLVNLGRNCVVIASMPKFPGSPRPFLRLTPASLRQEGIGCQRQRPSTPSDAKLFLCSARIMNGLWISLLIPHIHCARKQGKQRKKRKKKSDRSSRAEEGHNLINSRMSLKVYYLDEHVCTKKGMKHFHLPNPKIILCFRDPLAG